MNRTLRQHLLLVADVGDLLVVGQPALEVVVERGLAALADRADRRADLGQRADELLLVGGEPRLDEDDVHGGALSLGINGRG
jgi:hypothetical protein